MLKLLVLLDFEKFLENFLSTEENLKRCFTIVLLTTVCLHSFVISPAQKKFCYIVL